jgi:hypothetical protein
LRSQDGKSVRVLQHGLLMLLDIPVIILNSVKGRYRFPKIQTPAQNQYV